MGRPARATAPRIVFADDHADTREMYAEYLRTCGYDVDLAVDGRDAIYKARRKRRPDVIIMDLQMPRLDGWGAMQRLQNYPATAGIPIIVLTGHDLKEYLKPAAFAAGACSFLMKPTSPEQLAREIERRLAERAESHAPAARRASTG